MNAFEFLKKLPGADLSDMPSEVSYLLTQFTPDAEIKRKNAAQIVYAFLKYALKISDVTDETLLSEVRKMKDVYDCPKCAHAIMQVTARRLMSPKYVIKGNDTNDITVIFGNEDLLSEEEASDIAASINPQVFQSP